MKTDVSTRRGEANPTYIYRKYMLYIPQLRRVPHTAHSYFLEVLAMDSSINDPVSYALGATPAIALRHLQHHEAIKLFRAVLQRTAAVMKYLSGFKPIGESLNVEHADGPGERRTSPKAIRFPPAISERTKMLHVYRLSETATERLLVRRDILLTEGCDLVVWEASYDLEIYDAAGNKRQIAKNSEFVIITDPMLLQRMSQMHVYHEDWFVIFRQIILTVHRHAEITVTEREERLTSIRRNTELLRQTLERIE